MVIQSTKELLDGLCYIRSKLEEMTNLVSSAFRSAEQLKEPLPYPALQEHAAGIETRSLKSRAKLLLMALAGTVGLFYALLSLLSGMGIGSALAFLVPLLVLVFGGDRKKLKIAAAALLVILVVGFTVVLVRYAPPALKVLPLVILPVVALAEGAVILSYNGRIRQQNQAADASNAQVIARIDRENEKIRQHNLQILNRMRGQNLQNQLHAIQREMRSSTADWFPPDYYYEEAVDHFIDAVRNRRVSNVQEMVNEYEAYRVEQQKLDLARKRNQKLDTVIAQGEVQIAQQEAILGEQRLNNYLAQEKITQDALHEIFRQSERSRDRQMFRQGKRDVVDAINNLNNTIRYG